MLLHLYVTSRFDDEDKHVLLLTPAVSYIGHRVHADGSFTPCFDAKDNLTCFIFFLKTTN